MKVFLLILLISIIAFNDYQIGYTEPTQQAQAISNQPIFEVATKEIQTITKETATSSEFITIINWLEHNYNHEELQINDISSQSLTPEYNLYIIPFINSTKKAYIVVKDNFEIIEYGEGSYTPYLTNIICDEEIKELEATQFYYFSPLENYWQYSYNNEVVNIDGATGEWLPQISEPITRGKEIKHFNISNINTDSKIISTEAIFDPYEDMYWLLADGNPMQLTPEAITDSINLDKKIIYAGAKYNEMVRFAYPIIGYQKVDELTYLALYDQYLDLIRYVSYDELKRFGGLSIYKP